MPPPNNRLSKAVVLSSLIGLGAGAALGYRLNAKPEPPPVPSPGPSLTSSAVEVGPTTKTAVPPAPYDLQLVVKGSLQSLVDFETWLATASCGEVSRLLLDPAFSGYPSHPPMSALIVRRFREFGVDERFSALQKHLTAKQKIRDHALLDVLSDLARDILPNRAEEMRELFTLGTQIKSHSIGRALADWAARDFAAAASFAGRIEGIGKEDILADLIGGLADRDLALAQKEALKPGKGQDKAVSEVAASIARKDLAAALDWLDQNGQSRGEFSGWGDPRYSAISAACAVDSAAAARLILDRPGLFEGEGGSEMAREVFRHWAAKDPAAASAWLAANPLSELHQAAALKALEEARRKHLPLEAALAEAGSLPVEARTERLAQLTKRLVMEDPAQAMARFASLMPEGKIPAREAEAMLDQLPDALLPEALRQFPGMLEDINEHGGLMHRLTGLASGPMEELLPQLPEKTRQLLQKKVMEDALSLDPERALQMAEGIGKEALDPFASGSLAVHLAGSDPQKAVDWVAAFPEGPNREWAAQNLMGNWVKYDPDAALAWLETLPPGRSRERAALEAAKFQAVTGNQESALALAAGIGNAKEREEATGFALQPLWNRDPAAAAAALSGSGLAAEQQAGVEKKLKQGGFRY